jgi:VCBS repeat-containing protein
VVPSELVNLHFDSSGASITETGTLSFTWLVEDLMPGQVGVITVTGVLSTNPSLGLLVTNTVTASHMVGDEFVVHLTDTAVIGVEAPPVANDDSGASYTTSEDSAFITGNVLTNDTDPNVFDSLSVAIFDASSTLGAVTYNHNGTFSYDPQAQFETLLTGEQDYDAFSYVVADTRGLTDTAMVTITISGVNDAPTISDIVDQRTDTSVPAGPIPFTVGDADTPLASLVLSTTVSNPALVPDGNVAFGGSGANRTVTLTPTTEMTGTATVTVTVYDESSFAQDAFLLAVGVDLPLDFSVYLPAVLKDQ